ncbi:DUF1636 domain-containing protein [Sulfitobacter albidus]|uniref:DUF1636 domain-containing protein n=2 Tax=Sulfitobacter albidus TaxID=2829501 RepID=A0A975PP78_9RHOB|nr:DUF1636 domain-containing protein [Sulfitobacter albidus]
MLNVCTTCAPTSHTLAAHLRDALPEVEVRGVDCMSGCARAQTVAFRAPGKVAYLFGEITEDDVPDLRRFIESYVASSDGTFADARILGGLRHKALARIPA